MSTWVNGLSQAVSYLDLFAADVSDLLKVESFQSDGNIFLLMPVSQGKSALHSLLSQTLLASADDLGTRRRFTPLWTKVQLILDR